jgi:hypothetical protein
MFRREIGTGWSEPNFEAPGELPFRWKGTPLRHRPRRARGAGPSFRFVNWTFDPGKAASATSLSRERPSPLRIDETNPWVGWKGSLSGDAPPNEKVWVGIHPLATDGYWMQGGEEANEFGRWEAQVTFGRNDHEDRGCFEIKAFVGTDRSEFGYDPLKGGPKAQHKSLPRLVFRNRNA